MNNETANRRPPSKQHRAGITRAILLRLASELGDTRGLRRYKAEIVGQKFHPKIKISPVNRTSRSYLWSREDTGVWDSTQNHSGDFEFGVLCHIDNKWSQMVDLFHRKPHRVFLREHKLQSIRTYMFVAQAQSMESFKAPRLREYMLGKLLENPPTNPKNIFFLEKRKEDPSYVLGYDPVVAFGINYMVMPVGANWCIALSNKEKLSPPPSLFINYLLFRTPSMEVISGRELPEWEVEFLERSFDSTEELLEAAYSYTPPKPNGWAPIF